MGSNILALVLEDLRSSTTTTTATFTSTFVTGQALVVVVDVFAWTFQSGPGASHNVRDTRQPAFPSTH